MPPTLPLHLKRGLDFDASPVDPNDLVEDVPTKNHGAQDNSAKRRRVEAIALQYLRGRAPLILTARLKGPFNRKWENPWAKPEKEGLGGPGNSTTGQAQVRPKRRSKAPQVASPEASRAVGYLEEQLYSQPELEPLPATAPIPDDGDLSGGTEFFSVDTEQFVANNCSTNPFWLRRPATSITFPANSQTDKSPSRIRKRDHRLSARKSLQLAPPKEPHGGRPLPIRATPPDEWLSDTSASICISSPSKPTATIKHHTSEQDPPHTTSSTDIPDSSRLRADSAQEEEARSSQAAQYAQIEAAAETASSVLKASTTISPQAHPSQPPHAQSFDSLVPATTYKISSTVQVPQSSPTRVAVGAGDQTGPSQEDMHRFAERLVSFTLRPTLKEKPSFIDRKITKEVDLPRKLRHDLVASPAPDSSTGFVYRRVGQPKGCISNTQKAKPRAVSFSSSPSLEKKDNDAPGAAAKARAPIVEAEVLEDMSFNAVADATERSVVQQREHEMEVQEDEQQESYRSRQSQYSTQAAMLLAQLEFQEDSSQSSTSTATLRPWSQPAQNTTPALLPQPSPAITPLSVFNARMDLSFSDLAGNSVLNGPPISTQDLFNAASPFAFSTMKKKSQRPRRTSLRFALTSKLNESMTATSPTPLAQRVPLKDKNISTMWSFLHEKSSTDSPKPTSHSPLRTTNDVELPHLDFHTSLDFGPNADFTDHFLKGLENEP